MQTNAAASSVRRQWTTEQLAAEFHVVANTPRAALCRAGHWMGMRPTKLPNGKLLWDAAAAERVLNGEVAS